MSLSELLFLILLAASFAVLVSYVRHDGFTRRRNLYRDELGIPRIPR
jgi:hypothetical protein